VVISFSHKPVTIQRNHEIHAKAVSRKGAVDPLLRADLHDGARCLSEDDQEFSPDVAAAWEEEICCRMKSVTTGVARSRSIDEVFADLDRRFAR